MTVLIPFKDLHTRGIQFSRMHISRLVKQKKFPPPVKIGKGTNAWLESEIEEYLTQCIAKARGTQPATA
jgi:prophage regulatory protein